MLITGAWRVADRGDRYVVVEVSPKAAFAYLWDKNQGICSHVWLFNCEAELAAGKKEYDDAAPPMPTDNVILDMPVPSTVGEISCVYNITERTWDLHWAGKKMAALSEYERPGCSQLVKSRNDLAKPFESPRIG